MQLYTYRFDVSPSRDSFNAHQTRPVAATVYVRYATSKANAVERFKTEHVPFLRRNGVVGGVRQAMNGLTVTRISHVPVGR